METPIQINNEVEKRISDAFCVFDQHGDKYISVADVGEVLRFLGCVPSEAEVAEVIRATEEENINEVHLSKFMAHVTQLLIDKKMMPASPEKLLKCFQAFDEDNRKELDKDEFATLLMTRGEVFTQEEVDEMMTVAVDPRTGKIPYEAYICRLKYTPKVSIYDLAESLHVEKSKPQKPSSSIYGGNPMKESKQ